MAKVSPWITAAEEKPVEMSSRIRLARNVRDIPFPHMLKGGEMDEVTARLKTVLSGFGEVDLNVMKFEDKALLVEKHLISPLFTKRGQLSYISGDESVSIMVNEEDHIRIQVMGADESLDELYERASELDDKLEAEINYAFDDKYGFLTACPTNVGTGLRASVMLHLPGLSLGSRIQRIASNLNRFGFTLRGIYGEGSVPLGHIYQLSNQLTLGRTEEDIISSLNELKMRIMEEENEMRSIMNDDHLLKAKDSIYRSYGTLKYAHTISLKEAANHLSNVKLGMDLNLLPENTIRFQEQIQLIQPAFIKMRLNTMEKEYGSLERAVDEERATLLRELIGGTS
ncbi:protein arginine kinase [Salinicoccus halitifaciens]|uniref:Protein arginine kinase n=1 Tax=Salinicoccus halitifaciens TaxID=1073415 RepID=A0ABV2EBK7_9STAP|nr:protein arginine kinase [Salinicoccus halitifaciens]MCD2138288.1 protein arginine kinase [Salinicoccus halitifaciens]